MKRYNLYDCETCAWFCENECKSYGYIDDCGYCPNKTNNLCNCFTEVEEDETKCPYYKEYKKNYLELEE